LKKKGEEKRKKEKKRKEREIKRIKYLYYKNGTNWSVSSLLQQLP
jgi:hypothetical protein